MPGLLDDWKVAILVDGETKSNADQMVIQLRRLGYDTVHVFGSPRAKINKQRDVIVHQDKSWYSDYTMWKSAIETMISAYASTTKLFLFVRPGMKLWEQLPVYCEETVDMSAVGLWSAYTPDRVFPDERQERPYCGGNFGWCSSKANGSLVANHCLVFTRHALTLCGAYMPKESPMGANTAGSIGSVLEKYDVPIYFHTPSLVNNLDNNYPASDFVGCSYHLNQRDIREQNFILSSR